MEKGLAIVRDKSGKMLQCMECNLDEQFYSTVFSRMDEARVAPGNNVGCCEVWHYASADTLSLLATFF